MKQSNLGSAEAGNQIADCRQVFAIEMQAHSSRGLLHRGHLFAIASPGTGRQLWPQLWPTPWGRRLAAAAATPPLSGNQLPQASGLAAATRGRTPSVSVTLVLPPTSASDARGPQAKPSGRMLCLSALQYPYYRTHLFAAEEACSKVYQALYYYHTKGCGLAPERPKSSKDEAVPMGLQFTRS